MRQCPDGVSAQRGNRPKRGDFGHGPNKQAKRGGEPATACSNPAAGMALEEAEGRRLCFAAEVAAWVSVLVEVSTACRVARMPPACRQGRDHRLFEVQKGMPQLQNLDVGNNKISDAGAIAFAGALSIWTWGRTPLVIWAPSLSRRP